jgi:hypothetical protein
MHYFELYLLVLQTISEHHASNFNEVVNHLNSKSFAYTEVEEVLNNLINDKMISGKLTPTKYGNIYLINHLTIDGNQFLKSAQSPVFQQNLIDTIKQEGVPLTTTNVIKFAMKLIF